MFFFFSLLLLQSAFSISVWKVRCLQNTQNHIKRRSCCHYTHNSQSRSCFAFHGESQTISWEVVAWAFGLSRHTPSANQKTAPGGRPAGGDLSNTRQQQWPKRLQAPWEVAVLCWIGYCATCWYTMTSSRRGRHLLLEWRLSSVEDRVNNITIEFMLAGINMFWARLRLLLKWVWERTKTYLCPRTY